LLPLIILITHKHTLNMTLLDEGSACRRSLYMLNAQHSQETDIHVPGGIHTLSPSADLRGHWEGPRTNIPFQILAAFLSCLTIRILYLAWLLRAIWWNW
jgi:hypothetical protein